VDDVIIYEISYEVTTYLYSIVSIIDGSNIIILKFTIV